MRIPVIILTLALLAIVGCNKTSAPLGVKYDIIKETPSTRWSKDNIDIRLSKKINEQDLSKIATVLRQDRKQYDRLWIFYYLPGMVTGRGAWATTHFNPDLEVMILGLSIKEEKALTSNVQTDQNRDVIGTWIDTRPGSGVKMVMFYADEKLFLERSFSDGSSDVTEMKESLAHGDKKVEEIEDNGFGEFYLINKSGGLEFWSENVNYFTAKKIG